MSNLDNLMSALTTAAARVEVERPKKRRGRAAQTDAAVALKRRAAELRLERDGLVLSQQQRAEESAYLSRVARLRVIGKRRDAARRAMAAHANDCTPYGPASRLARLDSALRRASDAIFSLPIIPAELGERGRFLKRAEWLGLSVGMTAADALDIVQMAAELCIRKGQTVEDKRTGAPMPTIGGMYRNLRLAFNAQVDLFRQHKRHGVTALYSFEGMAETMGADWMDANASRLEFLGYGLVGPDEYPPVMVPASHAAASRAALTRAERIRAHREAMADWDRTERDALASVAAMPAGADRLTFERDRVAIRVLINGGTVADVAAALGESVASITDRLLTLEGTMGATVHSGPGSDPVRSTLDHSSDAVKYRHQTKGWTASKHDGTRASEVLVTRR